MELEFIIISLLIIFANGLTKINNEFNSNIFDDDMEYALVDGSDEFFDDGMEHFFRQVRSLEEDYKNVETIDTREYTRRLPKSEFERRLREINEITYNQNENQDEDGNFSFDDGNGDMNGRRIRRSSESGDGDTEIDEKNEKDKKELQRLVDAQEKPLEIIVLDISNSTDGGLELKELSQLYSDNDADDDGLKINDFIRFKRDLREDNQTQTDDDIFRSKREKDEKDNKRDASIKEQWIKQPYPVVRNADQQLDENLRAPRVNFVTQRRSESAPLPFYYNYEPNYRHRDFPDDYDKGYYPRFPRHYQSYQDPYQANYYRDENPRDLPPPPPLSYENDNVANYYHERPVYKQRRIIYYATLPEVVRSPPNDRYNYRDSYETDSRYPRLPPQDIGRVGDSYRYRKQYPIDKTRYEESPPVKSPYPLKVSTDVNVKEIKKSPERRIYSDGDHRYIQGPYQPRDRY